MSSQVRCIMIGTLLMVTGCAEGPLWRTGKFSPWAREKWEAEAKIAETLFVKKQRLTDSVAAAVNSSPDQQESVAKEISEVVHRDPVLLLRLHGVKLIGQLDGPTALQTLQDASRDHNSDIRIAAVNAWKQKSADIAVPQLQEMLGSDTNVDVRLAATRALANFPGDSSVRALALALNDSDPALQLRATESLHAVTGQSLGRDVVAWQKYVDLRSPAPVNSTDAAAEETSVAEHSKPFRFKR